ncbi:MAG: glycosyltransferase [Candidatus Contendobacter sp.]|nr:glycosyltransferase [Candidatus Contendobacter sp.]MDG4558611.1 glycosyltransferase [Candidatus Contendobacter sp.]
MSNLVSVVIPLYNHEKFIEAAIKSAINQTISPGEIIVINDGSTDGSHTVMQRLCQEHPQIKYIAQANQGAHAAINTAIQEAAYDYIAILNSDDLYHPKRLETCLKYALADPSVDMIATAIQGIDQEGKPIELVWCNYYKSKYKETNDLFLALVDGNFLFTTSNVFIKRSVFDRIGTFARFRYAHDLDFFLRLITHGKKIVVIDEPLLRYRIHDANTISENYHKVFLERDAIVAFHIYSRVMDHELVDLERESLVSLISCLTKAGRLETVLYYFFHCLRNRYQTADAYLSDENLLAPDFYSIKTDPPDSFIRSQKNPLIQKTTESPEPVTAIEKVPETEFQRIGRIAVTRIGDKLKHHPLLSTLCVKAMRGAWMLYRYFKSRGTKRFFSNPVPMSEQYDAPVVFIGHDAGRTGAPIVLLNLLRWIKKNTSLNFKIVLRGGGELSREFMALGPTLIRSEFGPDIWIDELRNFIHDSKVKLIYSNTAVNGDVIDDLKSVIDAPDMVVISTIHELEHSIQRFAPGRLFELVKKHTTLFIAVSNAVKANLETNHAIPSQKIKIIHSFVPVAEITEKLSKVNSASIRQQLDIDTDAFVVGGCGTTDWRKGIDLFIQIAKTLLKMLAPEDRRRIRFIWVGGDLDSHDTLQLSHEINGSELLRKCVIFTGVKEQVVPYFSQFDVFLLSSREDPFPLVCLEAGALEKPVICFEKAGGAPDLVEDDGGFVVPYLDVDGAARALYRLFHEPDLTKNMGKRISEKVRGQYDVEVSARQIFSVIKDHVSLGNHASG